MAIYLIILMIFSPRLIPRHQYATRLASKSTFSLPKIRTNYGKFNIKFIGPKTWNDINESLKSFSKLSFKRKLKQQIISGYDD